MVTIHDCPSYKVRSSEVKFEGAGGGKSKVLRNSAGVFLGSIVKKDGGFNAIVVQLYSQTNDGL